MSATPPATERPTMEPVDNPEESSSLGGAVWELEGAEADGVVWSPGSVLVRVSVRVSPLGAVVSEREGLAVGEFCGGTVGVVGVAVGVVVGVDAGVEVGVEAAMVGVVVG